MLKKCSNLNSALVSYISVITFITQVKNVAQLFVCSVNLFLKFFFHLKLQNKLLALSLPNIKIGKTSKTVVRSNTQ